MMSVRGPLSRGSAACAGHARSAHRSRRPEPRPAPGRLPRGPAWWGSCSRLAIIATSIWEFDCGGDSAIRQPESLSASFAEQRPARLHLASPQRNVSRMVEDDLLSFAAQDEADEFLERRIGRLAGSLVEVEESNAAQGVGRKRHVFVGRRLRQIAGIGDQRNHAYARIDIGDTRIRNSVAVVGDAFGHGKDDLFEGDVLAPFAALVALAEDALTDELLKPVPWLDAIDFDRLVCPLSCQSEVTPLGDGLAASM